MNKIFEENKNLNACFRTSDGKFFFKENAAKTYAKEAKLKDNRVEKLSRPMEKVQEDEADDQTPIEEMTIKQLTQFASEMEPPLEIPKGSKRAAILELVIGAIEESEEEDEEEE